MEDFNIENMPVFEDAGLNEIIKRIEQTFHKGQQNFVELVVGMHDLKERFTNDYFNQSATKQWSYKATDKQLYTFTYLVSKLGFSERQVNRLLQCYDKFLVGSAGVGLKLLPAFSGYTPSKLFELLPVSKETLLQAVERQLIKPSMTVKELRDWVKSLQSNNKGSSKVVETNFDEQEEIDESEIPMAFDIHKKYEFEYFRKMTKNQLLNIVWKQQKALHS